MHEPVGSRREGSGPRDVAAAQAAKAEHEQRQEPGGEEDQPDDPELAERVELDRVSSDRRLAASPFDEVGRPEAAIADPGQRMVAELGQRDPPEVVAVRAEADEMRPAILVARGMLEGTPAVAEVIAGVSNRGEEGHGNGD